MRADVIILGCLLASPVQAWDPVSVFNNAVQGQVSQQINRGVAGIFQSIETPSVGKRADSAELVGVRSGDVVLYSTPSCGYCKRARAYLDQRGIPYLEKDVLNDAQAESEWRALGGRGVPLTIMGRHQLTGFSAASFDTTYARFQADQASGEAGPARPERPVANVALSSAEAARSLSTGDLLTARIANVNVLAEPRSGSAARFKLAKQEEVIYLGDTQGPYVRVKSASTEGWVELLLLRP